MLRDQLFSDVFDISTGLSVIVSEDRKGERISLNKEENRSQVKRSEKE